MKQIPLTKGRFAIVDDEDFEELNRYKWYSDHKGYAARNSPYVNGKRHVIWMHRVIAGTPAGMETDHINGIKNDNRRSNLRIATTVQNAMNRGLSKNNTSGYRGGEMAHTTVEILGSDFGWRKATVTWPLSDCERCP